MWSLCGNSAKTIIEIGAFPGRFLAYLSAKYSLKATALDYNSEIDRINDAFTVMYGSRLEELIKADFLRHTPVTGYDIVLSIGFIEHFANYEEILDRHLLYLNQGGVLVIMIPNKRNFRRLYGYLLDYRNLKAHNLRSMRLSVFRSFASRNRLKIRHLAYQGGFPYRVHQDLNLFQKVIYKAVRAFSLVLNPFFEKYPCRLWSGTIVAILTKEND